MKLNWKSNGWELEVVTLSRKIVCTGDVMWIEDHKDGKWQRNWTYSAMIGLFASQTIAEILDKFKADYNQLILQAPDNQI